MNRLALYGQHEPTDQLNCNVTTFAFIPLHQVNKIGCASDLC